MSEMSESLLTALWRASWQGGLVIAILWCLCRTFWRYRWFTADLRCWLWRAAYLKLLVGLAVSGSVVLPVLPAAKTVSLPFTAAPQLQAMPVRAAVPPIAIAPASVSPATVAPMALPWQTAVAVLYGIGVSVCLVRVVRAGLQTRQLLREASPTETANADSESEMVSLANQLALRRVPRLRTSARTTIPVYAAGTVLLPADTRYTSEERRLILAHELAHARRRDLVWEWLGTLTQIAFFFHPLVLLARREERLARESAADILALQMTRVPVARYGKLLLSISQSHSRNPVAPPLIGSLGVVDRGAMLHQRLLALKEISVMSYRSRTAFAALAVTASALVLPWQISSAAPQSPARGGADTPLFLQGVPYLPLIPLAKALDLNPDQKQQIRRIQMRTAEKREKILLRQTDQRQHLAEQYLPGGRPEQQTTEYADASENLRRTRRAEYEKYRKSMHRTIDIGKQETRQLEQEASRSILDVLSDEQEKALPGLLSEANTLKWVGIPISLYSDLALSQVQKERIAAIAHTLEKRQNGVFSALLSKRTNWVKQGIEMEKRGDKKGIEVHRREPARLLYVEMREMQKLLREERQRAFAESLAVLTPSQRRTITAYRQAHPEQKQTA